MFLSRDAFVFAVAVSGFFLEPFLTHATETQLAPPHIFETDVVVYGGTSGGIVAAVAARRMGKSTVVVAPDRHLGGMTSGGLSWTDIGNKPDRVRAIGGIAREVYRRIGVHYGMRPGTEFDVIRGKDPTRKGVDFDKPPSLSFEPKVAWQVFRELLTEAKVDVVFESPIASVSKDGVRIRELKTSNGKIFRGRIFIDATYEGDLLAAAGISYTVGREANATYGETVNGIQGPANNPRAGAANVAIDPFRVPGDPKSGPLPYLLQTGNIGEIGSADGRVQSYNYRVTLTDRPENRRPIEPPADYDESNFELVARWIAARQKAGETLTLRSFLKYDPLQNGKYDFNNRWMISTDFIGGADDYPEADAAQRAEIAKRHEDYLRGFLTFLATSKLSPPAVRAEMSHFGLCRDEFTETGGWPNQLYVREARRMIGDVVMTEQHVTGKRRAPHSVGLGTYGVDMHAVRRVIDNGQPVNEGTKSVNVPLPYPIDYGVLTPRAVECDNLYSTFAVSASHIAFGSIRMEPVFMTLSQSAATAACLTIDADSTVQAMDYESLQKKLLEQGVVLQWKELVSPDAPRNESSM